MSKMSVLLIGFFCFVNTAFSEIPEPPLSYLMEGGYSWKIDDPNGIPGKAILYYDLPPYFDGVPDLVLAFTVYSVNHQPCLPKNIMTAKYIFLNAACKTKSPLVYVLERPNFAARMFRLCELRDLCFGWLFTESGKEAP